MYRLSSDDSEVLRHAARHNPHLLRFFEAWRLKELEELPLVAGNVSTAQGRCQVLGEIVRHINEALKNSAPKQ